MENRNPNKVESERLLGIAKKLLQNRDFGASKNFAILSREKEPQLDGADHILAIVDVLIASEKRINNHHDWYSILQVNQRSNDLDLIKRQYRRLALLLHPDKNKFPFAEQGFKIVAASWAVLSDPSKKSLYDKEFNIFVKVDLSGQRNPLPGGKKQKKNNVNDNQPQDPRAKLSCFWTACPYCYLLYEYPRIYEGRCLRCQNCQRAFQAILLSSLPPLVPGQDAYYCCREFFPMAYMSGNSESGGKSVSAAMFTPVQKEICKKKEAEMSNEKAAVKVSSALGGASMATARPPSGKKRRRP